MYISSLEPDPTTERIKGKMRPAGSFAGWEDDVRIRMYHGVAIPQTEINANSKLHAKARKATEENKHIAILRHRAGQDKGYTQRELQVGRGLAHTKRREWYPTQIRSSGMIWQVKQ